MLLFDAIIFYMCVLQILQQKICPGTKRICSGMASGEGIELLNILKNNTRFRCE